MTQKNVPWDFIKLAMNSIAESAIIPMQDILGLGEEARMNRPASSKGNWSWRLRSGQITNSLTGKLLEMPKFFEMA